jgi:hypothetical protein
MVKNNTGLRSGMVHYWLRMEGFTLQHSPLSVYNGYWKTVLYKIDFEAMKVDTVSIPNIEFK